MYKKIVIFLVIGLFMMSLESSVILGYSDINVVPSAKKIPNGFIMGVDISSIIEIEKGGGKFYDINGNQKDIFKILSENKINTVRARLWHNPKSPRGINGGGMNDLNNDLIIARRAKDSGMKFILDLHYSDSWADPSQQTAPYAWQNKTYEEIKSLVYEYTKETISAFKKRGITIDYAQVGNEINNGMIFPYGKIVWGDEKSLTMFLDLLKEGIKAFKEFSPETKIIIHYANGCDYEGLKYFFESMNKYKVQYDIMGISYYSFIHGSIKQFEVSMNKLVSDIKKPACIMEYSYAYTTDYNENTINIFNEGHTKVGGYKATIAGQKTAIKDIINIMANIEGGYGIGVVYWEPAWIPVKGVGWGGAGTKASWANQALFDYNGKATESIKVFSDILTLNQKPERIKEVPRNLKFEINLEENETLPKYVRVLMDSDAYRDLFIKWQGVDQINKPRDYQINGLLEYGSDKYNVAASVTAKRNFIKNSSFEYGRQNVTVDEAPKFPWTVKEFPKNTVRVQSKGGFHSGASHLNYYNTKPFEMTLSQNVAKLENGTYTLGVYIMGVMDNIKTINLFADNNGVVLKSEAILRGWNRWIYVEIPNIEVKSGKLIIGVSVISTGESWGQIDDFSLTKVR